MSVTMEAAISAVREMFDANEVKYTEEPAPMRMHVFSVMFSLHESKMMKRATVKFFIIASRDNPEFCDRIMSYTPSGLEANEDYMAEVAEYLHRANYGMSFGNFEMDFDDGEIRYRMALNCVDALPGFDAIEDMLYLPLSMFERYADGLIAVNMGIASAQSAIDRIED